MGEAWALVGKTFGALLLGIVVVFGFIPEKRNAIIQNIEPLKAAIEAQFGSLQASGIKNFKESQNESLPKKDPLPESALLISTQKSYNYEKQCSIQLNAEKPDSTAEYRNTQIDQKIALPFNKKWGGRHFRVNPYEIVHSQRVEFGYVIKDDSCNFKRSHILTINANIGPEECVISAQSRKVEGVHVMLYQRCSAPSAYKIMIDEIIKDE